MKFRNLLLILLVALPTLAYAQDAAIQTAIEHFTSNFRSLDLSEGDVSDLLVTDAYTSRRSGTTHVYLRQGYEGIGIVNANYTVNVNRSGAIFHTAGIFLPGIEDRIVSTTPAINAGTAADIFARDAGLSPSVFSVLSLEDTPDQQTVLSDGGVARDELSTRLVFTEVGGELRLAWEFELFEASLEHLWYGLVDAIDGTVLKRVDHVISEQPMHTRPDRSQMNETAAGNTLFSAPFAPLAQVGSYRVFELPVESPDHSTPPRPADGRTLHANPDDATASPFGWHDTNGVAGAEFTDTRGNNVDAAIGGSRPDGGGSLVFDFPADFSQHPSTFQDASTAQVFYMNNVIHDVMYHYGFDEASGNFQSNNYGNGGAEGDPVDANVQILNWCNATFGTPSDGSDPTMSLYICTSPNPDRDVGFDTGVVIHEFGHGISNRLTGGPGTTACLDNLEQAGEGWSDFYGMVLTMRSTDTATTNRGVATYSLTGGPPGSTGIRLAPYNTNFAVNSYTYGDTVTMGSGQQHARGFVFNTILWEVLWELIDAHGFDPDVYNASGTAGNQVMIQLVTEGLKLQPCSPGFVDVRDAIIQADLNLYGGAHLLPLWTGFARRGLGEFADQGSSFSVSDNVEDFTIPPDVPVELVAFTATTDANDVVLEWGTASETNNAGFEIQLLDGESASNLGFVDGHGTTTEAHSYTFRATDLDAGTHTFRLKQIDFDGTFEYSQEIEATVGVVGSHTLSEVYPNPFNPQAQFNLAVSADQLVTIAVYDVMGRQVATIYEGQLGSNETHQFTVDGSGLASGAYLVRIAGESFADTRRITLLK